MADPEIVSRETADARESIEGAQLVIGMPSCGSSEALSEAAGVVRAALAQLAGNSSTAILYPDGLTAENGNSNGTELRLAPHPFAAGPVWGGDALYSMLRVNGSASAKAFCVWNSAPESLTKSAMEYLAGPILDGQFDLAVAQYSHFRYDALINSGIVRPLTRALYGLRIGYPMAMDLALSAKLAGHLLRPDPRTERPAARPWITARAASGGFRVCQSSVGVRPVPPPDSADVSTALAGILESLFADIDRNAAFWQRTRASRPVPGFGTASVPQEMPAAIDVRNMIETFQLGFRNLREIWGLVLPPATMLELKKLSSRPSGEFRLRDELWARCVYDFALGFRLRVTNKDHLLRAMTPLYLAWVASYALEVYDLRPEAVEDRLGILGGEFEAQRPYLLSRWRWPDRFNP
jgi:hypothetical protein